MKKQIKEIIIRKDLYPRFEVDNKKVQEYSENIENLPAIIINQDNILIDGLHRLRGHKQAELKEIEVIVEKTVSENELYLRAVETNSTHGLQLNSEEKAELTSKFYGQFDEKRICKVLSISHGTYNKYTTNVRKAKDKELNRKVQELYLKCKSSVEILDILKEQKFEIEKSTIYKKIEDFSKKVSSDNFGKNGAINGFSPELYNIWNIKKIKNNMNHFGNVPIEFTENLLYYYTQPFDIIYDPFAGGGATIDVCKKWYRKYFVCDRKPIEGRDDIIKFDIKDGLPNDLPNNIKLVFLDPPYWKQAENQYSKDKEDLSNMSLEDFYNSILTFAKNVKKKLAKDGKIALIIQGSQWKNNLVLEDHSFEIAKRMDKLGFKIQQRIICPYSTEQYNAQQVIKAKEKKICLQTYRDLIVFELK